MEHGLGGGEDGPRLWQNEKPQVCGAPRVAESNAQGEKETDEQNLCKASRSGEKAWVAGSLDANCKGAPGT